MDCIESKGKTVDEAVFSGLLKMDLSIDEVHIEIIDEGGSLFRSAKVKLTKKSEDELAFETKAKDSRQDDYSQDKKRKTTARSAGQNMRRRRGRVDGAENFPAKDKEFVPQTPGNDAEKFLLGLFSHMGMGVKLQSEMKDGLLKIDLSGRGMGLLIGRRGETLDALQYLTSLVLNSGKDEYTKVMLDTEHYRKKREDTLKRLAARLSAKVQKNGKRVALEPMNPYERRILHATLQDDKNVYTYSEGEDPFRCVVVDLRKNDTKNTNA